MFSCLLFSFSLFCIQQKKTATKETLKTLYYIKKKTVYPRVDLMEENGIILPKRGD